MSSIFKHLISYGNLNENSMSKQFLEVYKSMSDQKEVVLLQQLAELVNRGLIEIESTQPILVQTQDQHSAAVKFEIHQKVKLVPKNFEYIQSLEKENAELKLKIEKIEQAFNGMK